LDGFNDPGLLDRAASDGRVLVSHDLRTMLDHFSQSSRGGENKSRAVGGFAGRINRRSVEALVVLWAVTNPGGLSDQAYHLSLRFGTYSPDESKSNPTCARGGRRGATPGRSILEEVRPKNRGRSDRVRQYQHAEQHPQFLGEPTWNDIVALILKSNGFPGGNHRTGGNTIADVEIIRKHGVAKRPANARESET